MVVDSLRQADAKIEVTPAMIEAGLSKLDEWIDDYGVDDVPAASELVFKVLRAGLQCHIR